MMQEPFLDSGSIVNTEICLQPVKFLRVMVGETVARPAATSEPDVRR